MFTQKLLQYTPVSSGQGRIQQPMTTSLLTNGRVQQMPYQHISPQPHQLYPQQEKRQKETKSIGVGANLNYTRGAQFLGRPPQGSNQEIVQRDLGHSYNSLHPPRFDPPTHASPAQSTINQTSSDERSGASLDNEHAQRTNDLQNTGQERSSTHLKGKFLPPPHMNQNKSNSQKIVSQNLNGTLSVTGVPGTESELQLFRVLQRANLLSYFDCMIDLGGDDVQQLCDAGEEEFLEIMSLIGMASKPLHVRRLQKALQEFISQPNLFPRAVLGHQYNAFSERNRERNNGRPSSETPIRPIPCHQPQNNHQGREAASFLSPLDTSQVMVQGTGRGEGGIRERAEGPKSPLPKDRGRKEGPLPFTLPNGISVGFPDEDCLNQEERERIRDSEQSLVRTISQESQKTAHSFQRKISAEDLRTGMRTFESERDSKKPDEIRKLFPRLDSRAKNMTVEEGTLNEAGVELCRLITKTDQLRNLAREVVAKSTLSHPYTEVFPSAKVLKDNGGLSHHPVERRPRSAPTHSNLEEERIEGKGRPDSSPPTTQIHPYVVGGDGDRKRTMSSSLFSFPSISVRVKEPRIQEEPNDLTARKHRETMNSIKDERNLPVEQK